MLNMASFIRVVREAQDIAQGEIARKLAISQSALAQFERRKATLSTEKIRKMATFLNLNPDFVESGIGNPFKQLDEQKIIKMFLSEDDFQEINFDIIYIIADSNKQASFFLVKPNPNIGIRRDHLDKALRKDRLRWRKQRSRGIATLAIVIQDADKNVFIFKRKDNQLFNEEKLLKTLKEKEITERKYFNFNIVEKLSFLTVQDIRDWTKVSIKLIHYLYASKHADYCVLASHLIHYIWTHESLVGQQEEQARLTEQIREMTDDQLRYFLSKLIPEIAEVIRRTLGNLRN